MNELQQLLNERTKAQRTRIFYAVCALIVGLSGITLIACQNWKIALGVFLVIFGENLNRKAR